MGQKRTVRVRAARFDGEEQQICLYSLQGCGLIYQHLSFQILALAFHCKLLIPSHSLFCPIPNSISYCNFYGCPPFPILLRIHLFWGTLRWGPKYTFPKLSGISLGPRDSEESFPLHQDTPLKQAVFYLAKFSTLNTILSMSYFSCNANKLTFVSG